MIIGIDATNCRSGGAVTYLIDLLRVGDPLIHGFSVVVLWAPKLTCDKIEDRPWLLKRSFDVIDNANYIKRGFWQANKLGKFALSEKCDIIFVPGGSFLTNYRPIVTASLNLLPFEFREIFRYGFSAHATKFLLLRLIQSISFNKANGVIFLSHYAQRIVLKSCCISIKKNTIIPFGVNQIFFLEPRQVKRIDEFSGNNPFKLVYNSSVEHYKHHCRVVEAVYKLREKTGWPISLEFFGPGSPSALKRLKECINHFDSRGDWLYYYGILPRDRLVKHMHSADLGVFASSCENLPNSLLETMASGLPIACSNRGPMPEVLGDAGIYFDPEQPADIARALREMIMSPQLRSKLADASYQRSLQYSWQRCAEETFEFLRAVVQQKARK